MPRAPLVVTMFVMLVAARATPGSHDSHLDQATVTGGCAACHQGHGVPRSPMLPGPQKQLCLSCHGSMAETARRAAAGAVSPDARPPLIGPILGKLFSHPIDDDATSAGTHAVTCTSCHSPHRGSSDDRIDRHNPKRSPRNPAEAEFELCESCHGRESGRRSLVARKFDPNNRSFHPVEAPAPDRADSVDPDRSGGNIACTDCHGNDDRMGPRGPHASNVQFVLNANYRQSDGPESQQAFALCYGCHDRNKVLERAPHATHVATRGTACRTCHDGHGSVSNRALIQIGEDDTLQQVLPSMSTGRLQFVSDRRGMGACYLTCHGIDHGPKSYGTQSLLEEAPSSPGEPTFTIAAPPGGGLRRGAIERPAERVPRARERP